MIGREPGELVVELRLDSLDARGRRLLAAWADGRLVARVVVAEDQGRLRAGVDDAGATLAERQALIGALTALARSEHLTGVVLAARTHLMLRYAARAAGFVGPLRADLVRDFRAPQARGAQGDLRERLLLDLNALLPESVTVTADRQAGVFRSWMRTASSGVAGTVHLVARDGTGAEPLRLGVPLREDVIAEGVALTIDTALAIRQHFRPLVDGVRIFYDQSMQGLRTGTVAGAAYSTVRDIHLSPAYASANELEAQHGHYQERQSSRMALPPFTLIDAVVAHEYWHQMEFGLESGRYRDSVEFRRAVGAYFGVETVEHVIKGAAANSPPAWQAARVRLAEEVSAYAATAPKEATAELFTQWWCTASDPPPSAQYFREVLRRFFPNADLAI